jgi:mRNA interferase MazF
VTDRVGCTACELILVRFDPVFGHEQAGTRPALVISRFEYNARSSFVVVCPITRNPKPWPFKIALPEDAAVRGFVLIDQLKSVDQRRIARRLGLLAHDVTTEMRHLIDVVLATPGSGPPSRDRAFRP